MRPALATWLAAAAPTSSAGSPCNTSFFTLDIPVGGSDRGNCMQVETAGAFAQRLVTRVIDAPSGRVLAGTGGARPRTPLVAAALKNGETLHGTGSRKLEVVSNALAGQPSIADARASIARLDGGGV
jgi:hypothetical protein